jgi:HK97 gp10 family phage protein
MADEFDGKLQGVDELVAALLALPGKMRKRMLRNALAAGGRVFRDEAKRLTPVISVPTKRRAQGTVQKAITVRTSKQARRAGDVGVFVNVRPAKGANRGAASRNDPFYWRFIEFGTKAMRAFRFMTQAAGNKSGQALRTVTSYLGPAILKLNKPNSQG